MPTPLKWSDLGYPDSLVEEALKCPRHIHFSPPYIACSGSIAKHTDELFDPFSAFLVLRNDGCVVWQFKGYRATPQPGECFCLNIHKAHGVTAKDGAVLVVLCADGKTREDAERNLESTVTSMLKTA